MLIQRAGAPGSTLPPRGFAPPAWMSGSAPPIPDAPTASRRPQRKDLLLLNEQVFTIGHDDFEADDANTPLLGTTTTTEKYEFGWDNEHPRRQVSIDRPVLVEKLCITNAEYLSYLRETCKENENLEVPASWAVAEDPGVEFKVCLDDGFSSNRRTIERSLIFSGSDTLRTRIILDRRRLAICWILRRDSIFRQVEGWTHIE